ncbi:MAG: hypothetical protein OXN16_02285, partial [Gammaproteobacteria bacterium]|nr:hypothetical protein [Gammaproteobacteria bacterium]
GPVPQALAVSIRTMQGRVAVCLIMAGLPQDRFWVDGVRQLASVERRQVAFDSGKPRVHLSTELWQVGFPCDSAGYSCQNGFGDHPGPIACEALRLEPARHCQGVNAVSTMQGR